MLIVNKLILTVTVPLHEVPVALLVVFSTLGIPLVQVLLEVESVVALVLLISARVLSHLGVVHLVVGPVCSIQVGIGAPLLAEQLRLWSWTASVST